MIAFVLPLVVLGVLAEQRGATGVGAILFVSAIATLIPLQFFVSRG
jgi:hypothetical protein